MCTPPFLGTCYIQCKTIKCKKAREGSVKTKENIFIHDNYLRLSSIFNVKSTNWGNKENMRDDSLYIQQLLYCKSFYVSLGEQKSFSFRGLIKEIRKAIKKHIKGGSRSIFIHEVRVSKTSNRAICYLVKHVKFLQKKQNKQKKLNNFGPAPPQNWQLPHVVKNVKYSRKLNRSLIVNLYFCML